MIIQNRVEEQEGDLKENYQSKIDDVLKKAKEEATTVKEHFIAQVQEKIRQNNELTQKLLQVEYNQKIAKIRLDWEHEVVNAKANLAEAMREEISIQLNAQNKKAKQELIKKMHKRILQKIKKQGFKKREFTVHIWRQAKIPGCKSTLKEVAVRAESDDVIVEDSIEDIIDSHYNDIIRIITMHVEENLN